MNATQITHNDLDGYAASTVVGAFLPVSRIVHVARYSDIGPVVDVELKRLTAARTPELLIVTDLGLEAPAVNFLKAFAAMNAKRAPEQAHRLVVLDHHASSLDQLREQGIVPLPPQAEGETLRRFDLGDPAIVLLIDEGCCATRMAFAHRALYATQEPDEAQGLDLATLVEAVDALDLWKKERPTFLGGHVLDEVFWDNVSNLVPLGHPWHDRFVGELFRGAAGFLRQGLPPARIETEVGALRARVLDRLLEGEPDDDRSLTTRMRIARILARSETLFRPLSDGTLLSFGLDSGMFQRVSDRIMESGRARRVVNVQRTGSLSFRSNDETALDGARRFRGGGHKDAAGGRLPNNGSAFSIADALSQVEPVLNPPAPDPSASPFGALKNWKG
ncbi:dimethylmenaquinone methyltransferase [Methylobacterium sp. Leaf399]|uniref:dimethylmenaquinone methyltransferase n=1 Tax=Methylobacterium sp. Leaf399 TaxID=1736364 RepID=UPI000700D439|nr:dimethylmenaquinone methyltransferase [Methylobacterium sp. Leaf399]KQT19797.1 dimethylmenaquinone methyltransferase [Methylobacterium sp. Leaf399]